MTVSTDFNNLGHPTTEAISRPQRPAWLERHERYCARAKAGGVDLLFLGDSLTQRWETAAAVWDEFYGRRRAAQMGIDNDQTQQLLWRIENGCVAGIEPRAVVLLIGINNLGNEAAGPEEICAGIAAVAALLRRRLPAAKVLILGMLPYFGKTPFADSNAQIRLTNAATGQLADGKTVHYLDVGGVLLGPGGSWRPEIQPDKAHLSPEGHRLLATALEPKIRELLGE